MEFWYAPKSDWKGFACVDVEKSQEDTARWIRQTRKSKGTWRKKEIENKIRAEAYTHTYTYI